MRNATSTQLVTERPRQRAADDQAIAATAPAGRWVLVVYAAIFCGAALLVYHNVVNGVVRPILASSGPRHQLLVYPSLLWVVMGTLLFGFRTCVWIRYRPFPAVSRRRAPLLTVIVPAYNEGAMVLSCIESVVKSDYPRERLQIVAIDDGSVDDTWSYIETAVARYPALVTAVRHPRNLGKREALAAGFDRARGSIVVTLDSDSVVQPDTLRALAGPFRDQRIGAVAGKVLVYNRRAGIIPRMLHVRFVLSFDFLRCVESAYGNVFCCPGALTAYRASAVRPLLARWKGQTFLGAPCTFGEDRALTNYLLEAGFNTVYQRSAVVRTVVPARYGKLCRMFIRWDRSYVREEIRFARIVWKRPMPTRLIALYDRFVTNFRYPVYYWSLLVLAVRAFEHPMVLPRMLMAIGLISLVNMLYYLRSERSPDFVYGVLYSYFSFFTLFWIFPYSFVTVRTRSWLTR